MSKQELILERQYEIPSPFDDEDMDDNDLPDNTSVHGIMPKLPQELVNLLDSTYENGPPSFGGALPPSLPDINVDDMKIPDIFDNEWCAF